MLALGAPPVRAAAIALPDALEPPTFAAQAAITALPVGAQEELFTLYARYGDAVSTRRDEGWRAELLSDESTEAAQKNTLPARQLEESVQNRLREIAKLDQELAQADPATASRLLERRRTAQTRLKILRADLARPKGTCLDWSDMTWAQLRALKPKHWSVRDQQRRTRPFHTAAVLCSAPAAQVGEGDDCASGSPGPCPLTAHACLVFDPWPRGQADVYEFGPWDNGSFDRRLPADFFLHQLPEPRPVQPKKPIK